jgi:signal peptidase I
VTRGTGSFLRDNIEAFAVAIALALVIRHYCVEAFQIPTGSMMPTLYGDREPLHGDRILVDKVVPQLRDPKRWEVWVFQYPLNRSKNYIKRIVGLPGEHFRIVDGDIWTSRDGGSTWGIERKPPGIRESLLLPYYPWPVDNKRVFVGKRCWKADEGWEVDEKRRRFDVHATEVTSILRFDREILAYNDVDRGGGFGGNLAVGDVRVALNCEVERPGTLVVCITEHGQAHRLVLGADESRLETGGIPTRSIPLAFRLEEDSDFELSFANVDDTLLVDVDGEELEIPIDTERTRPPDPKEEAFNGGWRTNGIHFEATSLQATLHDVAIDRDLHYDCDDPDEPWVIPDGHFFALGDNTQSSKDSRMWEVVEVSLESGEVVAWSQDEPDSRALRKNPSQSKPSFLSAEDRIEVLYDIDGLERVFFGADVEEWPGSRRQPYISRDHLVGRAFSVFWPVYLWPIYKGPTRIRLIR